MGCLEYYINIDDDDDDDDDVVAMNTLARFSSFR